MRDSNETVSLARKPMMTMISGTAAKTTRVSCHELVKPTMTPPTKVAVKWIVEVTLAPTADAGGARGQMEPATQQGGLGAALTAADHRQCVLSEARSKLSALVRVCARHAPWCNQQTR